MGDNDNRRTTDALIHEMHGTLKSVVKNQERMLDVFEKHAGQGEGTEHSIINKRLSAHSTWINLIRGGLIVIGMIWAALSDWFKRLFQ